MAKKTSVKRAAKKAPAKAKGRTSAKAKGRAGAKAKGKTKAKAKGKSNAKSAAKAKGKKATSSKAAPASGVLSVAVGMTVNDIAQSIAWYCDVLGCSVAQRWVRDGVLTGASVQLGGVTFNLGQDDWKQGHERVKGQGVRLYIQTGSDIAKLAAGIKARGGVLTQELAEDWGYKLFSMEDPTGYKMTFMCRLG